MRLLLSSEPVVCVLFGFMPYLYKIDTKLQTERSRDLVPLRWIFSNLPNPSRRTMALGSTQPLTEMSTRNIKKETWGQRAAGA
jgi:hypothetical protein